VAIKGLKTHLEGKRTTGIPPKPAQYPVDIYTNPLKQSPIFHPKKIMQKIPQIFRSKTMKKGCCKLHGGLSTGPKTPEGKARALVNLKQFMSRLNRPDTLGKAETDAFSEK